MVQYWRVFALTLAFMAVGAYQLYGVFSNAGYTPQQPIPFSHVIHAGVLRMECLYCHSSAEKSAHAGIPSADLCMGCHSVVRTDSPYIQKLKEYYDQGKPLPWVRVHHLPEHAFFNHRWHVAAGVACQECHGPVQSMPVVKQWQKLEMGKCMECHRQDTFVANIHHPETSHEAEVTPQERTEAKASLLTADKDSKGWKSAEREFKKYADVRWAPEDKDAMMARLKEYQADIYQHGRVAQARNKNASIECNTCHH